MNTKAAVKTAITIPAAVLAEIDRAARARGESRSKYITRVLRAAVRARRDAEITRRLNELFADETFSNAQESEAGAFDAAESSWTAERW